MLQTALSYLANGLCVLPAKLPDKRPDVPSWKQFQDRLPTEAEVRDWFHPGRPARPCCLLTGKVSGNLEMIDFDLRSEAFTAWAELVELNAPGLVARLVIERSLSGGKHVIYRCENEIDGNTKLTQIAVRADSECDIERGGKKSRARKIGDGFEAVFTTIETRGEGGIFLCAPSPGYVLEQGSLTAIPTISQKERHVLLTAARALNLVEDRQPVVASGNRSLPAPVELRPGDDYNERGEVRDVLTRHGWQMVRGGDNELWRRPGKDDGWSATYNGSTFFVHSSSAAPFDPGRGYSRFSVYAMLEHHGNVPQAAAELRRQGFGGDECGQALCGVDVSAIVSGPAEEEPQPSGPQDPGPFPRELIDELMEPGDPFNFMGEVIRWNLETAHRPQPTLALAGAIALQSVLCARKIRDEAGNRTNLYLIGLGRSGSGKNHARLVNRKILSEAGAETLEGSEEIASDAGLVAAVCKQPAIMFQLDEFGRFLETAGSAKHAPHLFGVMSTLMKLYTSSNTIFRGKAYADATKNQSVDQPCVILHATTQPAGFYAGLQAKSLSDGSIARLIQFEGDDGTESRAGVDEKPPRQLVDRARHWFLLQTNGNLSAVHPEPIEYEIHDQAGRLFADCRQWCDEKGRETDETEQSLWCRVLEKAMRLALVYVASEDPDNHSITADAARWGIAVAGHTTEQMVWLAAQWVSRNETDARKKTILRIIRDNGNELSARDLGRKTQWLTARERRELLDDLTEHGILDKLTETRAGRPSLSYRIRS